MGPLAAVLLGAVAAGGTYVAWKEVTKPKPKAAGSGVVNPLQKGRIYAILVMLDWSKIPGAVPAVPDRAAMANYIKVVFGGGPGAVTPDGLGFKVLSEPMPRDEAEAKKFFAGQPSAWVINAQWLKDAPAVTMTDDLNKVFPMAQFTQLPIA